MEQSPNCYQGAERADRNQGTGILSLLVQIENVRIHQNFGNKARGLKKLQRHQFPVPATWVIATEIRERRECDPDATDQELLGDLEQKLNPDQSYAVRSSGELEDGTHHSYAGQFTTVLDVKGAKNILEAVLQVWASAGKDQAVPYAQESGRSGNCTGMAVIIQEMVNVEWSGVAFSINPVTGRNETVIEGVPGSGEQLVQEGITPERWIHHQGTWEEFDQSSAPPQQVLEDLVSGLKKLSKVFGGEVDVEWGWDGKQLWYLQCRSVTTHTFPTIYSNHISREVLPGMIKPLVWSVNIPIVNSAWLRLLESILGRLDILPEDLSRSYYYRAYFNMGAMGELFRRMGLPKDSLESLMGRKDPSGKSSFKPGVRTMKYLPGMLWFLLTNLNLGKNFRRKIILLDKATDVLQKEIFTAAPEQFRDLFDRLHTVSREAAYWNIIIPLTMQISNRFLQRKMEKKGEDFNNLDFPADFPELVQYDPQYHLEALAENWRRIPETVRSTITSYDDLLSEKVPPELLEFRTGLLKMIESFGHFSESGNDFSSEPWRENPGFLFEIIRNRDVKTEAIARKEKCIHATSIKKSKAYRRAGHYRLYREMISASYTRTYGLFRTLFMVTGKHFVAHGYLDQPGDVFYLTMEQHNQLLGSTGADPHDKENEEKEAAARRTGVTEDANVTAADRINEIREKVERVKSEMSRFANLSLPSVIYGETPPPIATPCETLLRGIPVSPGVFEGEIVVVNGYKDFNKAVDGKILVIPFSDVGWTPILSHAGAIITESGGMLSHASIIARELGIPAISSVDHACQLRDGTHATIDGYNGTLKLQKNMP